MPTEVKVAQSVVGALGVLLVGVLAANLAGARAGVIAAAVAACYPPLIWISAYAFSEALAWPMGLAAAWMFDRAAARADGTAWLGLGTGAVAGLTALVRPATVLFLALAGCWLLWRRRWRVALLVALGAALVIGPWTVRNYRQEGRVVLIATEGGVTFWTGNNALARGEGDMAANPDIKRANEALRAGHPGLTEAQFEPLYYHEAFAWIGSHKLAWLGLEARKAFYLVVPVGPSYRLHSARYYAASLLSYGLLLPFALAGLWRAGRARGRLPGLWLLAASAVLACLIFFPQERFRIPVIDPALVVVRGRPLDAVLEIGGVMKTLVVLPTYNERPNLERIAAGILQVPDTNLLVVDDGSPDGTGQLADELVEKHAGRIEVMHRTGPRGLGRSYVDGLRRALETDAEAICQMDADFSHDPRYLPDLIGALSTFDLVIGSRYLSGVSVVNWPLQRIILSTFANRYIRLITGLGPRDCTSGFRAWRRTALARLPLESPRTNGYAFLIEMLFEAARRGCRIGEVPIIFVERQQGYSKVSSAVLTESLLTPWRLILRGGRLRPPADVS